LLWGLQKALCSPRRILKRLKELEIKSKKNYYAFIYRRIIIPHLKERGGSFREMQEYYAGDDVSLY